MRDSNSLRKFTVVGSSCAGKTTVSKVIAEKLDIEYIGIDYISWLPNWVTIPEEDLRRIINETTSANSWVIDGNYSRFHDLTLNRSEAIIWLNYSFMRVFSRSLYRTIKHVITQEEIFPGCKGYFFRSFCTKDSIIWYVIKTWKKKRNKYRKIFDEKVFGDKEYIECNNQKELDQYVATL